MIFSGLFESQLCEKKSSIEFRFKTELKRKAEKNIDLMKLLWDSFFLWNYLKNLIKTDNNNSLEINWMVDENKNEW